MRDTGILQLIYIHLGEMMINQANWVFSHPCVQTPSPSRGGYERSLEARWPGLRVALQILDPKSAESQKAPHRPLLGRHRHRSSAISRWKWSKATRVRQQDGQISSGMVWVTSFLSTFWIFWYYSSSIWILSQNHADRDITLDRHWQ